MRDFAPVDADIYPVANKSFRAHEKPVLGFDCFYDPKRDRNVLISVAYDSVKTWTVDAYGDEVDFRRLKWYKHIRCGAYSYDISPDGKFIIVVDGMNVLHVIKMDENGNMDAEIIDKGMMQIFGCKFIPSKNRIFSVNFDRGMQSFDFDGNNDKVIQLEKKKIVSTFVFSPSGKYLAIAFCTGFVEIRNGDSWELLYRMLKPHHKKIRAMEFSHDDKKLVIGCDDYTLSTHRIFDEKSLELNRHCYHTAAVLSVSFDYASDSDQFASASADQTVILWGAISGTPLHVFKNCFARQVVTAVNFSRDGRYLFSGTANGVVIVHKMPSTSDEPQSPTHENDVMEEPASLEIQEEDENMDEIGAGLHEVDISESDEDDIAEKVEDAT